MWRADTLPERLAVYAQGRLQGVVTPDAVRAVFAEVRDAETHPDECRCMVCGCGLPHEDHGLIYPVQQGKPNTGCMVACFLPGHVGQLLAQPSGEPMQDLHITLAYMGDTTETDINCDAMCACVKAFAASHAPVSFSISGVGRFMNGKDQEAVYAAVSSDALMAFRQALVDDLAAHGLAADATFSYTPHVTLCYVAPDAPTPDIRLPAVEGMLPYLWVAYRDRRFAYKLAGGNQQRPDRATQLTITECPECGKDGDSITESGYWYVGMTCPDCGHVFTAQDESRPVLDELRAFRADVLRRMEY